jgi:alkylhydroperoxidase family enzyme
MLRLTVAGIAAAVAVIIVPRFSGAGQRPEAGATAPHVAQFTRPAMPRIAPLPTSEWTSAHRQVLGANDRGDQTIDFFKICLRHVDLCRNWTPFTMHVASGSTLDRHDKELLILRTAYLSRDEYAWGEHALGDRRSGLFTELEIAGITQGPEAKVWGRFDAALLRAADELHSDQFIRDATWKIMAEKYNERQLLDAIFTVGQYTMIAMYLNSTGVSLVPGWAVMPK